MGEFVDWGANFAAGDMASYEDALVKPLFVPWGEQLLEQLGVAEGESLIDVACGPGTLALLAVGRVGDSGAVTGCDLSDEMLAIARHKNEAAGKNIEIQLCPAESLDFDDDIFDVAVCQQGLQFFDDRVRALHEMRRTVRVGGRIGVSVWCEIEACEPFAALETAINQVLGPIAAAGYRDGPWGFSDPSALENEFAAAGLTSVSVTRDELTVVFDGGVEQLISSLGAAPVGKEILSLGEAEQRAFHEAVRSAAAYLIDEDGVLRGLTATNTAIATV